MPCGCSDIAIGITPPYASHKDVVATFNRLKTCCVGAVVNGTDPIADPSGALNEGFPNGLSSDCACDVLWLKKPNGTVYLSANNGVRWYMAYNGSTVYGVLNANADPNDGGGAFATAPVCVDDMNPCLAYDVLGNVWLSFDRGTTWLQVHQALQFVQVAGFSGLALCNDGTATIMTGGSVGAGETSWYNPTTGEITVPYNGFYELKHRIEFGPGALAAGTVLKAELLHNGATVMRESQVFSAAHGNASYEVSAHSSWGQELGAGDDIQYRITIAGSGNETPWWFGVLARLIQRT